MEREAKRQWVDALRSGQYKQGHGWLKAVDGDGEVSHCCLGVAVEVLAPHEFSEEAKVSDASDERNLFTHIPSGNSSVQNTDWFRHHGIRSSRDRWLRFIALSVGGDAFFGLPVNELSVIQEEIEAKVSQANLQQDLRNPSLDDPWASEDLTTNLLIGLNDAKVSFVGIARVIELLVVEE